MTMLASAPAPQASSGGGGDLFRGFSSLSSRLTDRLKDSGLDNLVSGVKNFLPAQKDLTVTRLVASLLDPSSASSQALQETQSWLTLDVQGRRAGRAGGPTMGSSTAAVAGSATSAGKRDAIVFVVGGGSYVEYVNLLEWNARNGGTPLDSSAAGTLNGTGPGQGPSGGVGAGGSGSGAMGSARRITYGATEIITPHEFLQALASLAD